MNSDHDESKGIIYVVIWVTLSVLMTVFNKLVLSSWKFKYPFFLTCWHMILFTILTRILALSKSNLMPSVKENKLSTHDYVRKILPFSIFAAAQLVCSNSAYSFLSLAFIQILKAMSPVTLLILQYIIGKEAPSLIKMGIVGLISFGVILCTIGELNFNLVGFLLQFSSVLSDNFKALLADALLFNSKIDSISMLYYIAPPTATLIGIGFVIFELPDFPIEILTSSLLLILLLNGLLAFSLNVSNLVAVSKTSILLLSVCSPVRDAMVIVMSVIVFGAPLLLIQVFGFSLSLIGLYLYNEYKKNNNFFKVFGSEVHIQLKTIYDKYFVQMKNDNIENSNEDIQLEEKQELLIKKELKDNIEN